MEKDDALPGPSIQQIAVLKNAADSVPRQRSTVRLRNVERGPCEHCHKLRTGGWAGDRNEQREFDAKIGRVPVLVSATRGLAGVGLSQRGRGQGQGQELRQGWLCEI